MPERTGPFGSAWRKWDRGEQYRTMFKADFRRIERFHGDRASLQFEHDQASYRSHCDQRIMRVAVLLGPDIPQLSDDFPLILGDAIHNYRSALDHLTWALVRNHGVKLTPARARLVQFPTHNSAADFDRIKDKRTPGVPDEPQRAFLKRYQPYRRGDGPSAIRWLLRLSDHDKHREVVPTVIAPQGVLLQAKALPSETELRKFTPFILDPTPLKPGTPVGELEVAVPIPSDPRKVQVQMDARFTLMPLLNRRMHPGAVLANISATTSEIIERCEHWIA